MRGNTGGIHSDGIYYPMIHPKTNHPAMINLKFLHICLVLYLITFLRPFFFGPELHVSGLKLGVSFGSAVSDDGGYLIYIVHESELVLLGSASNI